MSTKYVTYQYLLTSIIGAAVGVFLLCGAAASNAFFSKTEGVVIKTQQTNIMEKLNKLDAKLDRILAHKYPWRSNGMREEAG